MGKAFKHLILNLRYTNFNSSQKNFVKTFDGVCGTHSCKLGGYVWDVMGQHVIFLSGN